MRIRHLFRLFLLGATFLGCVPSQAPAGDPQPPPGAAFVASSRGSVYYDIGCDQWRRLAPANLTWFDSAEAAEEAGYRPSASAGCAPRAELADGDRCVVRSVADGDTLTCEGGVRVRLLLIDSPEMNQGEFGHQARRYLADLAPPGTPLRVELDVQKYDRYDRLLAYLYTPDGRLVNEEMARGGFAVSLTYPPNVKHVDRIAAAVAEARANRVGLWRTSAFECSPVDHRAGRCDAGS